MHLPHQSSTQFLSYQISENDFKMDEGKVDIVRSWPTPITIKKLQLFLGFANFSHHFIKNFSSITSPLTTLMKGRPKSLSWTPSATQAMQILKDAFTSAPDPSRSRQAIRGQSQCFNNCRSSGAFTAAGETITTPSMFLLFQEALSSGAKL